MAAAAPVLPEDAAMTVPPGLSAPDASASSKIALAMRSFCEKPGLRNSALPSSVTPRATASGLSRLLRSTSGVPPIICSYFWYSGIVLVAA